MTELTENETKLLNALVAEGLRCMGGKKPLDLLEDNMSWFSLNDVMRLMSCGRHAAASFIGGLFEKNLAQDAEGGSKNRQPDRSDLYVTDEGIRLAATLA